ncbi:hypothetical protein [Sphingomonas sp. Leaf230]|nr:hypothetical protein [Sphingomonas sp. Leaf230]
MSSILTGSTIFFLYVTVTTIPCGDTDLGRARQSSRAGDVTIA